MQLFRATLKILVLAAAVFAQRPDAGPSPRPNPEREAALQEISAITTGVREDDHPAIASRDGTVWLAWVSYSEAEHAAHIYVRRWANNQWAPAERLTETAGDYHKPAITVDDGGSVWIAWPAQVRGNWDIYGTRGGSGRWQTIERYTSDLAPDLAPQLASTRGRVMLVWQSLRRNNSDVLYRVFDQGRWSPDGLLSESTANDWEPGLAATADGSFHVAWDSYRGDYDVFLRSWREGRWGPEMAVTSSPALENHATLTADAQNRVWIAWETGTANWAADSADDGLRPSRGIGLACLQSGMLHRLDAATFGRKDAQSPMLFSSADGTLRLFFREPINRNWLRAGFATWQGNAWSTPDLLLYSEGRIDQRVVAADAGNNRVMMVVPAGSSHNVIYARLLSPVPRPQPASLSLMDAPASKPAPRAAPRHAFRGYTVVWGDLHRHTDISEDGGIPDGSLIDAMRYSLDAAGLDFLGITDHTRYLPRRYNLYRIQQVSDLFYQPGWFAPLHAYERSQYTPWGHRNVVYMDRGHTPVPASYDLGDPGVSPWGLFDALRGQRAMSIPHTSAWGNKQVSWDYFDPQVERLVEIYQGLRSTYEYNGAPDPADRAVYEKDSKNFIWDALARGRKLGFIASSDHRSTHMSFAAVYVKRVDRESVFEGLNARRTYAATDKILIDFAIGKAIMGDEIKLSSPPVVEVAVEGTADLARVDVIRNGAFAYTVEPKSRKASFTFRDNQPEAGSSYYYVRVIQTDKQMAWASPIWVERQ